MCSRLLRNAVELAGAVAIAACTTETGEPVDSLALNDTVGMDTQISAGATADGWNDAQIFGLLTMVNGGRLAAAELAKARATNPEVKALADSIDRAHLEMEQELSALQTENVRSRAAVEQAKARVGRARQELLELEAGAAKTSSGTNVLETP